MTRRPRRLALRATLAGALLAGLLMTAISASAQTYTPTPGPGSLVLSTHTPAPGGTFTARGCGFMGPSVQASIGGQSAGTVNVGSDDCAFGTLISPSSSGTYTVCYTGFSLSGAPLQLCSTITVAAAAVPSAEVPFTGSQNLKTIAIIGAALVGAGLLLLVLRSRRRRAHLLG